MVSVLELRGIAVAERNPDKLQYALDKAASKYLTKFGIVSTHIGWPDGAEKGGLDLHGWTEVPVKGQFILVGSMVERPRHLI